MQGPAAFEPALADSGSRSRLRAALPELGLAALLAASLAWRLPHLGDYVHDDTFISLRYARNLLRGQGLTFNPGEHVEGYTNFLWTILLAALQGLHVDAVRASACLSALASLVLVALAYRFGVRYAALPHRAWALAAPLFLAAQPFLRAESLGGLETTLFVLLVFVGFERHVAEERGECRTGASGAAFGIATLVRPEGALLFGALLAARGVERRNMRSVASDLVVFALLVAPHLAFRRAYYGEWLPNTYYAKVGWSLAQAQRGLRYAWRYGNDILPLPALALCAYGAWGGGWRRKALWLAAVHVAYVVAVGGDYMPTGRFLILPLPFVALLLQSALSNVRSALGTHTRFAAAFPVAVALLAAAWTFTAGSLRLEGRRWPAVDELNLVSRRFLGKWLRTTLPRDSEVAIGTIGAVGYYSDLPLLDTFGITEPEIGRKPVVGMGSAWAGHEKGDADVVLRHAPRVIVFNNTWVAPHALSQVEFLRGAYSATERMLLEEPRFFRMYGLRTIPSPGGWLHYLERLPDSLRTSC